MRLILLVFVALLGSGCVALTPVAGAPTTAPDTPQSLPSQSVRTVAFAGNDDTMLAAVEALQQERGPAATHRFVQVTAADGIIRTSERELILETAETLDIDRDEAADLVRDLSP